uniref:Retrotransposon protein, putative, unclassified n=1 Tax=Oryza sativa subsp. japonica TaxID=39947 RepID=Q2QR36_ORYSJ|nr:retrotransposon protein, putative, unclassified [Oryza sativa Japonica Group]
MAEREEHGATRFRRREHLRLNRLSLVMVLQVPFSVHVWLRFDKDVMFWHLRLEHVGFDHLTRLSGLDLVRGLPKLKKDLDLMFNREKGKNVSGYASSNSSFQLNPPLASRELTRAHPWSIPSILLSSQLPLVGSQDQNHLSYHVGSRAKQAKGKKSKNQKRKAPMRTEEEVRKMTITSTEWPPAGITIPRRQRGNTFRGARQLTQHLLSHGGRVSDSEGSDQVSSDDEDESPRHLGEEEMESKACPRCGEIGHVASMCLTLCPHCEEDHPPAPTILCTDGLSKELSSMEEVVSLPDLLQAEQRAINLRRAIPSRRPLFASTSNQKEASPVNDSNMQSYHIITEPIKDAVTRTMPAM